MNLPLNEQQRRHLAVALDQVDQALLEVVGGAVSGDRAEPLQRFLRPQQRDLPAALASRLLEAALRIRSRLGAEIAPLGLHGNPASVRRRLAAYLTSALVLLEDCHSPAMAAYGDVDPQLTGVLDPWLATLEAEVNALQRMLDAGSDDAASG